MLLDNATLISNGDADRTGMRAFFEISPCAMSLWSRDRSFCLLNQPARRLINYTEADFLARRSLWIERIHPDDQQNFFRSQEAVKTGKSPMQCDYRFLPRSAEKPIWLRETSALNTNIGRPRWDILSVYTDISDLKAGNAVDIKAKDGDEMNAVKLLSHELMNRVQKVLMELELAKLGLTGPHSNDLVSTVDEINRSVASLRDQLVQLFEGLVPHDPSAILDVTVQKLRKALHRQRVNLRLVRRGPLPMVRADKDQLLRAFERVFEFCGAMLKEGGNLEIEAGPKELSGQLYAEVKVMSSSAAFLDDNSDAIQPYGVRNGQQIGLGMALAAEILGRYRGQVAFRKEGKNRGEVTILIKASPS